MHVADGKLRKSTKDVQLISGQASAAVPYLL
jgi:hypothetical protein